MAIDIHHLSVPELDKLIADAAKRRAQLKPDHPSEPPKEVPSALVNPQWFTGPVRTPDGVQIAWQVKHDGFGWLTFTLPLTEAAKLIGFWNNALAQAASGTLTFGAVSPGAGGKMH